MFYCMFYFTCDRSLRGKASCPAHRYGQVRTAQSSQRRAGARCCWRCGCAIDANGGRVCRRITCRSAACHASAASHHAVHLSHWRQACAAAPSPTLWQLAGSLGWLDWKTVSLHSQSSVDVRCECAVKWYKLLAYWKLLQPILCRTKIWVSTLVCHTVWCKYMLHF